MLFLWLIFTNIYMNQFFTNLNRFIPALLPLAALTVCPVAAYSAQSSAFENNNASAAYRAEAPALENNAPAALPDDFDIHLGTISDVDLFIHEKPSSEQMGKLLDLYNATVVMNSIMTDFDLYMRMEEFREDVAKAIGGMDLSCVNDSETASKLEEYKLKMLNLMSVDLSDADPWEVRRPLYRYLAGKYRVEDFGEFDPEKWYDAMSECPSVPEWSELQARRGEKNMVEELRSKFDKATDFDARCIYAIELAHAWMAEERLYSSNGTDIFSVMESLMKENRYSMYLYDLWLTYRVLYQDTKGASTYSEIPNEIYNWYRRSCVIGILSYIEKHPGDTFAVNTCFVLSATNNILRFGSYPYGNQYITEMYSLFGELLSK